MVCSCMSVCLSPLASLSSLPAPLPNTVTLVVRGTNKAEPCITKDGYQEAVAASALNIAPWARLHQGSGRLARRVTGARPPVLPAAGTRAAERTQRVWHVRCTARTPSQQPDWTVQ